MAEGEELNDKVEQVMGAGEYARALGILSAHSHLVERDWRLLWNLGWSYYQMDRYADAELVFQRAAVLAPDSYICKWGLGVTFIKTRKYGDAELALREALSIRESYLCRCALALALMEQGKLDEAETIHLEAIQLSPHDKERLETYADFLSDVGRETEANEIYQKARSK